jgi:hypothetical protein
MRLNEAQDLFTRTMLAPPEAVERPEDAVVMLFTAAPEVLPERLQIYRNTIVGTLTDLLLATYPMVKALTGEDFATVMLRSYVLGHPPHEACLARYGGGVADFIAGFAAATGIKYLPDVARLEWAMNEACYAVDDAALSPLELLEVQPDELSDLKLQPRASVRLVQSDWPLESIRAFCNEKDPGTLDLKGDSARLLVYRPELTVEVLPLAADEFSLFEALADGLPLGAAIEKTLAAFPAFDFGKVFQRHLELKTLRAFA